MTGTASDPLDLALRTTPANMVMWLRDPQDVVPGNAMPDMGLSEQQVREFAADLYTLDLIVQLDLPAIGAEERARAGNPEAGSVLGGCRGRLAPDRIEVVQERLRRTRGHGPDSALVRDSYVSLMILRFIDDLERALSLAVAATSRHLR